MQYVDIVLKAKRIECSDAEWTARAELACAYRQFYRLGWHELIYNHISLRVPGEPGHFLINPFGLMYNEVCASNLVKIDLDGNIVGKSVYPINPAGFVVHSAVHRVRHDANCVMHTHTTTGMAVAGMEEGLLPVSFPAMFYTDTVAYHEFEGITLDDDERERLAANLGGRNVMILRNHGLLSCGSNVAAAFSEMYHLQRACDVQVAMLSMGGAIRRPSREIATRVTQQFTQAARQGTQNDLMFQAVFRNRLCEEPDFLS
jgi:ribulose-5-phosphate 4-epimerase/fuculose-1-phosphate aldolase